MASWFPTASELDQWVDDDPLLGLTPGCLRKRVDAHREALGQRDPETCRRGGVAVCERDPIDYLITVLACCLEGFPVWFCSHRWGSQEWQVFGDQACPGTLVGKGPAVPPCGQAEPQNHLADAPFLVPGGGTTGRLRFARHTWTTLSAAADGLLRLDWIGEGPLNSVVVLPLSHVSGWMPVVRAIRSGGKLLVPADPKRVPPCPEDRCSGIWTLSLVPTQIERLLRDPALSPPSLNGFDVIFVGGAQLGADLAAGARKAGWPLSPCYGMTETAAMVTARSPQAFLHEQSLQAVGEPLPHVDLTLGEAGQVVIGNGTGSLFLGYHGQAPRPTGEAFATGDCGQWLEDGQLLIHGRIDGTLITGGEKVDPREVASVLPQVIPEIRKAVIRGRPDREWGTALEAEIRLHPETAEWRPDQWRQELRGRLAPHKIPRYWVRADPASAVESHRPKEG
ncbi:MAG: AMP-binding protein [Opitutales bacterium]